MKHPLCFCFGVSQWWINMMWCRLGELVVWVVVFQSKLLFASSGGVLKMEVVSFFRTVSIASYFVSLWKETIPMLFVWNWLGQGLVLNSNFGRMIFHIVFYRNMISFSVNHNFSSAYSALSDTTGGHFWASKLLRTCSLFKVTVPTYICISC